jgi:hypothetical protein
MAKTAKATCDLCEHRIVVGASFCDNCGCPTAWATHDERTAYEVAQYRHKSATVPMGVAYENQPPSGAVATKERRKLFARRSPARQITLPEPKRVEPPQAAPVLKSVPDAPKGAAPMAPKPARAMQPASELKPVAKKPVAKKQVAEVAAAAEPSGDTPVTILAVKMLNARVKELDAQVQKLSRELEAVKAAPKKRFGR